MLISRKNSHWEFSCASSFLCSKRMKTKIRVNFDCEVMVWPKIRNTDKCVSMKMFLSFKYLGFLQHKLLSTFYTLTVTSTNPTAAVFVQSSWKWTTSRPPKCSKNPNQRREALIQDTLQSPFMFSRIVLMFCGTFFWHIIAIQTKWSVHASSIRINQSFHCTTKSTEWLEGTPVIKTKHIRSDNQTGRC